MEFTFKKVRRITDIISPLRWVDVSARAEVLHCECGYKKDNVFPADGEMAPFAKGALWGVEPDSHAWFKVSFDIPESCAGRQLELFVKTSLEGWDATNPQFIVYDEDGRMLQGLDQNHTSLYVSGSGRTVFYFYAYSSLKRANLCFIPSIKIVNEDVVKLYYDLLVNCQTLELLHDYTSEYAIILRTIDDAVNLLDLRVLGSEDFHASVKAAGEFISRELFDVSRSEYGRVICIGHTHIDIAWLWTVAQTREKVQRTFATVIALMKRYPDYKFMSSQAYLYKTIKEEAPELYEEIKAMIKAGRWEVEGAMWVEADSNLPSGESLIRQIIYGKRFFKEEFGVDSRVLWLPDVFGYSAAMPQILRKSGVDWFVTSKIGWNEFDQMPYDLFVWRGIDGTPVNTYFLTAQDKKLGQPPVKTSTYNAKATPAQLCGTWERMQQKDVTDEALQTFGYGDGGGGPTAEMIETIARHKNTLPGSVCAAQEFAGDFLRRAAGRMKDNARVPEWRGELYLEFHRGTYTSIAKNKRNNRKCEFLALDTELFAAQAGILAGAANPAGVMRAVWESMLTNQFHDIIPGSSIREVYEVTDIEYSEIKETLTSTLEGATGALLGRIKTDADAVVFNPHSFFGSGVVEFGGERYFVDCVPPKGWRTVELKKKKSKCEIRERYLENDYFIIEFDSTYTIVRIFDKRAGREVLPAGARANELRVHEDFPYKYDAWDVSQYVNDKVYILDNLQSVKEISDSAGVGFCVTRRWGSSIIIQNIRIYDNIPTIDFETEVDWHERRQLLRAAFPAEVNAAAATFDIQFGSTERPTHKNTSWDRMKFETCAHKFADLSDGGYGISLMNDCKYGYDVHGNTACISLIKCAMHPNTEADQGRHVFTYSLYPHAGSFADADTIRLSYMLNRPMRAMTPNAGADGSLPEEYSLVECGAENVIIETVKAAEDGDGYIFRMYECRNRRADFELKFGFEVGDAEICDLLENAGEALAVSGNKIRLAAKPFEILTVRVRPV